MCNIQWQPQHNKNTKYQVANYSNKAYIFITFQEDNWGLLYYNAAQYSLFQRILSETS